MCYHQPTYCVGARPQHSRCIGIWGLLRVLKYRQSVKSFHNQTLRWFPFPFPVRPVWVFCRGKEQSFLRGCIQPFRSMPRSFSVAWERTKRRHGKAAQSDRPGCRRQEEEETTRARRGFGWGTVPQEIIGKRGRATPLCCLQAFELPFRTCLYSAEAYNHVQ